MAETGKIVVPVEVKIEMSGHGRIIEATLLGMMAELLHVADNGFMAPEVRDAEIKRIREEFLALTSSVPMAPEE